MAISNNNVDLIQQTRPYAEELAGKSVWVTVSTFSLLVSCVLLIILFDAIFIKLMLSVITGLLVVRCFILFHDFHHQAILRKSLWAKFLFGLYGLLIFTPSNVWRQSHNFHHAHNAVMETSNIGSFWTVSTENWLSMSRLDRFKYRIVRNPLIILFGVVSVFIYDHTLSTFFRNPIKNSMSLLAVLLNLCILVFALYMQVFQTYFFAYLLPVSIAGCFGAYLFYAQHNFPSVKIMSREQWSYSEAALHSSSYMKMSALMHWFTGNIGYHHVHHLNHRIPFYRLPEAMAGIKDLQNPSTTSLSLKDVFACLRLKFWDESQGRMISYKEMEQQDTSFYEVNR